MLCQSIIGIPDEIIISDYHQSEMLLNSNSNEGSAAAATLSEGHSNVSSSAATTTRKGKLSREIFSGSPTEVMVSTLAFIRKKYESINRYLDTIGFDDTWRSRLILATTRESIQGNDVKRIALKSKL